MQHKSDAIPLWQQLQETIRLLSAVQEGQSMTSALGNVPALLRPGVQALGFAALRSWGRAQALCAILVKRPPPEKAKMLLCLTLALAWREDAEALYAPHTLVDQTIEAAKRSRATSAQASFINAILRRFFRERETLALQTDKQLDAKWNHPLWWIKQVRLDHPKHWQKILQASHTKASMILRVNLRKKSQESYLQALAAIDKEAAPVGAQGIVLAKPCAVTQLPGFAEGWVSVQDAAAQLVAPRLLEGLHAAHPCILDACAAPGGKTAHLLELLDCQVTALDIDAQRCEKISSNLQRLGLQASVLTADAARPQDWWVGEPFDAILLDAPCTASGIVRRHPDIPWLRRPSDIAQLAAEQAKLLHALWPLVKPGGRLLYATCSVFRAEGEKQIQAFLAHHTDAILCSSMGHLLPQSGAVAQEMPHNFEHDGFYDALLQKQT